MVVGVCVRLQVLLLSQPTATLAVRCRHFLASSYRKCWVSASFRFTAVRWRHCCCCFWNTPRDWLQSAILRLLTYWHAGNWVGLDTVHRDITSSKSDIRRRLSVCLSHWTSVAVSVVCLWAVAMCVRHKATSVVANCRPASTCASALL